jgi:hypothetical protein
MAWRKPGELALCLRAANARVFRCHLDDRERDDWAAASKRHRIICWL